MNWTLIMLAACGAISANAAMSVQANAKSPRVRANLGTVVPTITYLTLYAVALLFAAQCLVLLLKD